MRTLGIDLASQPKTTAVCVIRWEGLSPRTVECEEGVDDDRIDELIRGVDVIGIDAPFGWPSAFIESVSDWRHDQWTTELRDRLQFRMTDRFVIDKGWGRPLSVASDRIALPAMRAMALLRRHGVTDRSGDGRFYEVYPAAALRVWGLPYRGYKRVDSESVAVRREILDALCRKFPGLDVRVDSADQLDALVAALVARDAGRGNTIIPTEKQREQACREGWIHIPVE